ncbi:deoxyribonuclease-1-like [Epinephelus lanceolatus]
MKIAAFNAKNLGWKKVTNKMVVHYLTKIMSQYSVVVILEVMDKSGKAMEKLLKELNNNSSNKNRPYSMTASSQLGRDTYKERFVCFYREDDVTLKACHQYEDNQEGDEDAFAREPFILHFRCPSAKVKDLVLIPVHTKPNDSLKELDELHDVVDAVRKKWRTNKIMILGDFNADGRYLSKRKKEKIRISSAPYHWLIKDGVDTTTSNCNDHTYDRIVVYRQTMLDAIVPGSAKPFNFQKEFNLTDEQTLSISDHYPVEVELKTNQKAPAERTMALPRTTKTTSIKRQIQKKGAQKKKKAELAEAHKKMAEPAGAKKKMKAEQVVLQKNKKADSAGAQKKMKTKLAGAEKKKKKKKAEPAGAQKKKKTEVAALQKTKNTRGKRKRGPSSDTPAKRRRLEKCQTNGLSTSCITQ